MHTNKTLKVLPQATQASPTHRVEDVLEALDKTTGGKWSFHVVDYDTDGDDIVLLGRIEANGVSRSAFGSCPTQGPGSLSAKLQAAALDALTRAAALLGIRAEATKPDSRTVPVHEPPATPFSESSGPGPNRPPGTPARNKDPGDPRISPKQIGYLYALGRQAGLSRDQVAARAVETHGRKPEHLTRAEASALIESMKQEVSP